jgi:hypothetical protein
MQKTKKITGAGISLLMLGCLWGCDDYNRTNVEESFYVNRSALLLFAGDQMQLTASPTEAVYHWSSGDDAVARVTGGLVEAVGEGSTVIVADNGLTQVSVPVTVVIRIPLTGIELSEQALELFPGDKKKVRVALIPENANDIPPATWTSENSGLAMVDQAGEITAMAEGVTRVVYRTGDFEKAVLVDVATTRPFKGPHVLSAASPRVIAAADFDLGGEGNAFHDNDSGNSTGNDNYRKKGGDAGSFAVEVEGDGNNIGYTGAGEWLIYTVEVEDAGAYLAEVSLSANGNDAKFRLEADGQDVTGTVRVPNNGSWNNWRWFPSPALRISLTEGRHKITYYFEGGSHNLKGLRFTKE